MISQKFDFVCEFVIISAHHPAVTIAAQILAGKETKTANVPQGAGFFVFITGTKRLRTIRYQIYFYR